MLAYRLREARGGDVMVRPGLVSELPVIRAHPADARASDGHDAQFRIVASVSVGRGGSGRTAHPLLASLRACA